MNSNDFCYWLKGYLELAGTDEPLTPKQMKIINDHLGLVFNKVTPDYSLYAEANTCFTPFIKIC